MIYKFFYFYFIKIFNHLRNIFTFQYQKISELKSYLQVQSSSSILLFKKRFIYFCHQTTLCYRLILFQFLLVIAITNMSHQLSKNSPQIHYKLQQILGVDEHPEHVHEEDIITSIQFDQSGGYLAIGDQAGRVIIFSSEQHSELQFLDLHNKSEKPQQLNYYGQFQSHVQQFDCLKSIPVNKSIKSINWLKPQGKYKKMITSNCQQIKLWKMHQKQEKKVIKSSGQHMQMPHLHTQQKSFVAISKLQFPVCHKGQINFVNISKNQQYLLSTDQKTALLWSLQNSHKPTIVEDINSKIGNNRWKEGQQISCSKYHPIVDSTFMIGSTKGRLELSDLRISFTNRNNLSFTCSKEKKQQNYFTDLVCRTSSIQFLRGGKYVVSRDYLTIKIWDICNVSKPINIINVNQKLKEKLCDLFENDCFDDDFSLMAISGRNCDGGGEAIATGSYNNRFNLIDPISGNNMEYELNFSKQTKRFPLHEVKNNFRSAFNHKKKTLYHSINPISHKIAVASLNSFFVYRPEELGRTKQNY